MSLVNAIRAGVATLQGVLKTGGLVVDVQRKAYTGVGSGGRDTYDAAATVPDVLLEDVEGRVEKFEGTDTIVRAKLTIFDPDLIVSRKDRWILPDGREMGTQIVRAGVVPRDGGRITTEVLLG